VTALRGLYACGEVTSTGVHGANRLASNSLTESIVAGTRVGRDLAWELPDQVRADPDLDDPMAPLLLHPSRLREIRSVMSRHVGVLRSAESLAAAAGALGAVARQLGGGDEPAVPSRRSWEGTNLLTMATAIVAAAQARTESRGCHRRLEYPEPRDVWLTHLDVALDASGTIDVSGIPVDA
jgi:L-aspartate oxidase